MKLYDYYRLVENADGIKELVQVEDPLPKDGYSHEPLGYVDPDDSADDCEDNDVPFGGVIYSFAGDCGTIDFVKEGAEVPAEMFKDENIREGVYYYRTGIYEQDEEDTHTGYDAVMWFQHESDPNF